MKYTTTVTQKGQITLPKKLREALNISSYEKVYVEMIGNFIKVTPTVDILDLAGKFKAPKGKTALKAREAFEANYTRI